MAIFFGGKSKKMLLHIIIPAIVAAFLLLIYGIYINQTRELMLGRYKAGIEKIENGNLQEGIDILITLGDYKDSKEQIKSAEANLDNQRAYEDARYLFQNGEYSLAEKQFRQL